MHRQSIIFLLSHKITTVQQKTTKTKPHQTNTTNNHDIQSTTINNHIYQSQKMVTTNNPHNLSIKNALKTNHQNKHNNPSHHTPRFLNIKIIAD